MTPHALDPSPDIDDDAPTLIGDRTALLRALLQPAPAPQADAEPEPLPLVTRRRAVDDEAWLATLPPATRTILEASARQLPPWPRSNRPSHAVARPLKRIPSLPR